MRDINNSYQLFTYMWSLISSTTDQLEMYRDIYMCVVDHLDTLVSGQTMHAHEKQCGGTVQPTNNHGPSHSAVSQQAIAYGRCCGDRSRCVPLIPNVPVGALTSRPGPSFQLPLLHPCMVRRPHIQ